MAIRARAFFDESKSFDPGYFAVAGFVGSDDQWKDFDGLWKKALETTGAPYLHMWEFAGSREAFEGWKNAKTRREKLMDGVVKALKESELTAIGSALRLADFEALPEKNRARLRQPYFCCLQDVLYGFALIGAGEELPAEVAVTGDRNQDYEADARRMYRVLRRSGGYFSSLQDELEFADMRHLRAPGCGPPRVRDDEGAEEPGRAAGGPDAVAA